MAIIKVPFGEGRQHDPKDWSYGCKYGLTTKLFAFLKSVLVYSLSHEYNQSPICHA